MVKSALQLILVYEGPLVDLAELDQADKTQEQTRMTLSTHAVTVL